MKHKITKQTGWNAIFRSMAEAYKNKPQITQITLIKKIREIGETPRRGDPHKVLRTIFRRPYWSAEDFHCLRAKACFHEELL